LRAGLANAQIHLGYVDWLAGQYNWLAGPDISLADLAAAAHISVLDYFGDVDWRRYPEAKLWYMKLKSRPSFRPLLSDVLVGMPPASHYSNLDF
jgi:glutathione S-transferase